MSAQPPPLDWLDDDTRHTQALLDAHDATTAASYATTWAQHAPALTAALTAALAARGRVTPATLTRDPALAAALAAILTSLTTRAATTAAAAAALLPQVTRRAARTQHARPAGQAPPPHPPASPPATQIDTITRHAARQIHHHHQAIPATQAPRLRAAHTIPPPPGRDPPPAGTRLTARAGQICTAGHTHAATITRTETADAYRATQAAADAAAGEIVTGWMWRATLSTRTCPACLAMHGTIHPPDEPGPNGHQRCRCTRVTLTRTPPGAAPITLPDAAEWFAGLTASEQRGILGPARWQAWSEGRYPITDWATRRETPGWRVSYVTSPVP